MLTTKTPPSPPQDSLPHRMRARSADKFWHQRLVLSPRTRVRVLAVATMAFGSVSLFLQSGSLHDGVQLAHMAWDDLFVHVEAPVLSSSVIESADAVVVPWPPTTPVPAVGIAETIAPATTPTSSPTYAAPTFASYLDRTCYYERDLGLISEIVAAKREFCHRRLEKKKDPVHPADRTHVTFVDLATDGIQLRAMVFQHDLALDFSQSSIHRPIKSLAEDGGDHDPRLNWAPDMISCGCREFQQYAAAYYQMTGNRTILRPWEPVLADTIKYSEHPSTVCGIPDEPTYSTPPPQAAVVPVREIQEKTVIITRRDDHNPFFQVAGALNAWLMMKALGWHRDEVRVVHMDGGYPSPIDELHHSLLSSPDKFTLLRGSEHLLGNKFRFTNQVMIAPYETTGPMMKHLDDYEPCGRSQLIADFRADALSAMGVQAEADNSTTSRKDPIMVTVISRRDYDGRTVQRRWLNEDAVLEAMRVRYTSHNGVRIVIQSVDFVGLTMAEQMQISLDSDVVIGMHGAGMVNVMWTKPGTLVLEIFPRRRKRWGYRNLCRYLGCDWHEFRGGRDSGRGDNASDKVIAPELWLSFFDPLFQQQLRTVGGPSAPELGIPTANVAPTPAPTQLYQREIRPTPSVTRLI